MPGRRGRYLAVGVNSDDGLPKVPVDLHVEQRWEQDIDMTLRRSTLLLLRLPVVMALLPPAPARMDMSVPSYLAAGQSVQYTFWTERDFRIRDSLVIRFRLSFCVCLVPSSTSTSFVVFFFFFFFFLVLFVLS